MSRLVNLKEKPYNLSDEQIKWVEETLQILQLKKK